jgi:F-type H+-transporting ATPase subunit b
VLRAVVTQHGGLLAQVQLQAEGETSTEAPSCTSREKFNNPSQCVTKEPNPVLPEMREIVWGLGSFLLLLVLMRYVAYPRLQAGTAARAAKIQGDLDAAERSRDSVGAEREAYAAKLTAARVQAASIIDAARAEVEGIRNERLGALNAELATLRSEASDEIAASRASALASMRGSVIELAVGAAERIVSRPIDRDSQAATVDEYVSKAGMN